MKLYFMHPITLVLAYSQFGSNMKQAIMVENYFRGSNRNHHNLQIEFNKKYSQKICKILGIHFKFIKFDDFMQMDCEPDLLEINLFSKRIFKKKVKLIIQSSDVYTAFDKKVKFSYIRTRIKLYNLYKSVFKNYNNNQIFIYSKIKIISSGYKINYLSSDKFTKVASAIGSSLDKKINLKINELASKKILLLLPPIISNVENKYYEKYMQNAIDIAKANDLEILIKPHRNDPSDHPIKNNKFQFITLENLCFYPVEFLFDLPFVKLIISEPSSALTFAPKHKLKVYTTRNLSQYRKKYLNQESFLKFLEIEFKKL